MTDLVGIVIVSHSIDIAKGINDMVRQIAGSELRVAFCGGSSDGRLGTNVKSVQDAIDAAWSPAGVVILVDLGSAEINSELAIEMLPAERRGCVVVCNAPIVEGAVVAAKAAKDGSRLADVKRATEELSPQ
jgi:PTS hybrid protein